MLTKILVIILSVFASEISAGCDSRCEHYNAAFLEIFDQITPFTESRFYENELLHTLQNLPVDATNAEKIATIEGQLSRINSQIQGFYSTIAALISAKMSDLTDLLLIESVLAGDHPALEFPYECIASELDSIAMKLKFLLEDSVRFAQILKDMACTRAPLNEVHSSSASSC